MKISDYIETAKRFSKVRSNAELAKKIGISESSVSRYKSNGRSLDNYAAMKIAEILKINPVRIIVQAEIEREKDPERQHYWFVLREKLNDQAKRDKEPFSETL